MSATIRSYVPEYLFTDSKHRTVARCGFEDVAVVDSADGYRVLACRGRGLSVGDALPDCWGIASSEIDFLEKTLLEKRVVLLQAESGPVLFFGALLSSTGVLLATRQSLSTASLLQTLRVIRRLDVVASPAALACAVPNLSVGEDACEQMASLFYYVDRILDSGRRYRFGLWSQCLLIAEFAGCVLDRTLLSVARPDLSRGDEERLIAFLLCTMLGLRSMSGRVIAKNDDIPHFHCRVEIETDDGLTVDQAHSTDVFPFLHLPAFSRFSLCQEQERLILDAFLQGETPSSALRNFSRPRLRLRLSLSPIVA